MYVHTLPLQLLTTGFLLHQGTRAPVILTVLHAARVVAIFQGLLADVLVAMQIIEDGTLRRFTVNTYPALVSCID